MSLDKFILERAQTVQAQIMSAYDAMDFHQVTQHVTAFCSQDLGSFYLDIIKDRQYTTQRWSAAPLCANGYLSHRPCLDPLDHTNLVIHRARSLGSIAWR